MNDLKKNDLSLLEHVLLNSVVNESLADRRFDMLVELVALSFIASDA